MIAAVNQNMENNENEDKKMFQKEKRGSLHSGSDFLLAFFVQILALWVAMGDAILEFVASYVRVVDGIRFDDDSCNATDPPVEFEDFRRDLLNTHNHCRSLHGCPALVISQKLTNTAQVWANNLAKRKMLLYTERTDLGENICVVDLNKPTIYSRGEQIARQWYSEIENYDYSNPGWDSDCFHATQLLWKESREIGVGIAKDQKLNKAYVMVFYHPPGNSNMPGAFQKNVPRRLL